MVNTAMPRPLFLRAINIVLVVQFGLAVAFDYLGEPLKLVLAGLVAASFGCLAVAAALRQSGRTERILLLVVLLMPLSWMIGYIAVPGETTDANVSAAAAFRNLAPFFGCIALVGCREVISPRVLVVGCGVLLATAIFHAATLPPVYLDFTPRLAPFVGLHTSAYSMALIGLLMLDFAKRDVFPKSLTYSMALIAFALVAGYGVRTVYLLVLVFLATDYAVSWLRRISADTNTISLLAASIAFAVLLAVFITITLFSFTELSQFTSGRLANYVQRFSDIAGRTVWQFILGTGPGSDKLVTTVWWWAPKDSHNDFIHLLWEGGLVALFSAVGFIAVLLRSAPWRMLAPLAALVASSAGSNALLERPNAAFLLFCLIAMRLAQPAWQGGALPWRAEALKQPLHYRRSRGELAAQFRQRFRRRLKGPLPGRHEEEYS